MLTVSSLFVTLVSLATASAHIALWDKGMFGYNYPYQANDANNNNYNNDISVWPLRQVDNLGVEQWFGHGYKGYPPKDGDFMELPSGGTYNGEVNCNRAGTRMRDPARTDALPTYACDGEGALHTVNRFNATMDPKWLGGSALAIAYTSDVASLQPNDMTIISVNQQSVWTREISFDIPANMPSCPAGGCLCTWNWIHQAGHGEGYGAEIYNVLYRCKITGRTNNLYKVQQGAVPQDCTGNPSACVKGPKTGMYLYQASGNNLPNLDVPPNYNDNWGFANGAQNDIFTPAATPASNSTQTPTATALPSGWTTVGCVIDADARALGFGYTSDSKMTITKCTTSCSSQGYNYAGVENGNECWCSNNPTLNTAPDSECSANCGGDPWAKCGGSWRLSVFKNANAPTPSASATPTAPPSAFPTASLPAGWSSLGCKVDSATTRALNAGTVTWDGTTTGCISACSAKGYPYAGTQYGQECWCGSASNANFTSAPDSECNVACSGDPYTLCGGGYRLNVYQNDKAVAPPASSSSVATSSASSSVSSVVSSSASSTASSVSSTASSVSSAVSSTTSVVPSSSAAAVSSRAVASSSSSSSATATSSAVISSSASSVVKSSTTSSTTTSSAVPTQSNGIPVNWKNLGCQVDYQVRVLKDWSTTSGSNSPAWCIAQCQSKGYAYAGVEYGKECYCGNTPVLSPASSGCSYGCTGGGSEPCGGYYRMNLYGLVTSSSSTSSSVSSSTTSQAASSSSSNSTSTSTSTSTPSPSSCNGQVTVTVTVTATSSPTSTGNGKRRVTFFNAP